MPAAAVIVPPVQVVDALEVAAITSPAGKVSEKEREFAARKLAVLSMVRVKVLTPPSSIGFGAKALANVGGGSTTSDAVAGGATTSPFWKRLLVELGNVPETAVKGTITSTSKEHMLRPNNSPPVNARNDVPVIEERVPDALAHLPQYANGTWRYVQGFRPRLGR